MGPGLGIPFASLTHSDTMQDGNDAAQGSRRWILLLAITGVLAWWLLGPWVASGSERFYLLVPPVALALAALRKPRRFPIFALPVAAVLAVLCVGYNLSLTAPLFPAGDGYWRGLSMREAGITLYFVLALYLLAAAVRRAVQEPLKRLLGRGIVRIAAAEAVLLAGLAPFLLSTFHVHRFKVPNPERPTALSGRTVEDIEFTALDGLTLRGWFLPAPHSERTLLICHGMGANRTEVLPYVAVGDVLQANVLLFDFRGHGDSDGHTLSFGEREKLDVQAAVHFLRKCRPERAKHIIGLGISMGTASLIGAAADLGTSFDVLILDSGFAAAADMAEQFLPDVLAFARPGLAAPALLLASLDAGCWLPALRPVDQIARLHMPVFIIHARGDRLIPVAHARQLYAGAPADRELWITDTGDHGSAFTARSEYLERVRRFVEAHGSDR